MTTNISASDSRTPPTGRLVGDKFTRVSVMLVMDAVLVAASLFAAVWVRFGGQVPAAEMRAVLGCLPWLVVITMSLFAWRGLYLSLWRYAGIEELGSVFLSTTLSAIALILLSFAYPLPRLAMLGYWSLLTVLMGGSRIALRTIRRALIHRGKAGSPTDRSTRVLIIGAGKAGEQLVTQLRQAGRHVVGFVDDDCQKQRMQIHGVRVLGGTTDLAMLIDRYYVDEVLIAIPAVGSQRHREIVNSLAGMKVRFRTVPSIDEMIDGQISMSQVRPVSIDDLLGRPPVKLNATQIAEQVRGEVLLVTGAGGSIGSELCRQVCRFEPKLLVMLGHGENSIFEAYQDVHKRFPRVSIVQVIADTRDRNKIEQVFAEYQPTYVLHAAAHKHVPYMEDHPDESVKTNVFGTQNVAQAALKHASKKFVMISTDKAVNPTSVMGATKRVAEMVTQDLNGRGITKFVSVRFGNVLGSRGSVVPIFQKQIAAGGPVTVTDPEMQRYFMTIPEASQLVLQAAALGQGGEVFVLDMGEPVRIVDLATNLIALSGLRPGKDIEIAFTGRRPGEKLYEEVLLAEEGTTTTSHSRIFISRNATLPSDQLAAKLARLEEFAFQGEREKLAPALLELVPNFNRYEIYVQAQVAATSN